MIILYQKRTTPQYLHTSNANILLQDLSLWVYRAFTELGSFGASLE